MLGASSSEAALPLIMAKLQRLGAGKATVGLVIPTGYSFNLDGTNIYMTLATLFLAQATNTPLSLAQEATLLGVAMLTSKGASGVAGAGFITLAATLAVIPDLPIAALALLVGVDRFMSACRALTNFVGNGVGTLVIARWEGDLDREQLTAELDRGPGDEVALLDSVEAAKAGSGGVITAVGQTLGDDPHRQGLVALHEVGVQPLRLAHHLDAPKRFRISSQTTAAASRPGACRRSGGCRSRRRRAGAAARGR